MSNELQKLMGGTQNKGQGTGEPTANRPGRKPDEEPKEQITVKLPVSLVQELREASELLQIPPYKLNMRAIVEQATRRELKRLKGDIERIRAFTQGDVETEKQAVNS